MRFFKSETSPGYHVPGRSLGTQEGTDAAGFVILLPTRRPSREGGNGGPRVSRSCGLPAAFADTHVPSPPESFASPIVPGSPTFYGAGTIGDEGDGLLRTSSIERGPEKTSPKG